MPLYSIPVLIRRVALGSPPAILSSKEKCLEIDGWGIFASYRSETELTPENIRRHLIGQESNHCIIEAASQHEAVRRFYLNYEGANVGGRSKDSKAIWIDESRPIMELPHCALLHLSEKRSEYICGEERKDGSGEFGMCVIENYDPPEFTCPITEFFNARAAKHA